MKFWIREANGTLHEGVRIQGNGGLLNIDGEARIKLAIDFATQHLPLPIYEPKPGHVLGLHATAHECSDERAINLWGAELLRAEPVQ